jgi:hypothetical protein
MFCRPFLPLKVILILFDPCHSSYSLFTIENSDSNIVPVVESDSSSLVLAQRSTTSPRTDASYKLCDKLCKLTIAASKLLIIRKPLFDLIRAQRTNDLKACTAHTVASGAMLWSFGGAIALGLELVGETALIAEGALSAGACAAAMVCWPVALVAGGLAIKNGVMAVKKHQDKAALDKKKKEYDNGKYSHTHHITPFPLFISPLS